MTKKVRYLACVGIFFTMKDDSEVKHFATNIPFSAESLNKVTLFNLRKVASEHFASILGSVNIIDIYFQNIITLGSFTDEEWEPKEFKDALDELIKNVEELKKKKAEKAE